MKIIVPNKELVVVIHHLEIFFVSISSKKNYFINMHYIVL